MQVDYLIVGQGIAGTVLGQTFIKNDCKIAIISDENPNRASLVAAGLYNPVTGKRMTKTWKAEQLFPFMENFYKDFEKEYSCKIIFPKPIYKPFSSIEEQNTWMSTIEDKEQLIDTNIPKEKYSNYLQTQYGGFETTISGHVNIPEMLSVFRKKLTSENLFLEEKFDWSKFKHLHDSIEYGDIRAKKIIFCEGFGVRQNSLFNWLPLTGSKGEVLKVLIENFTDEAIFNKQVFIVPLGNKTYRIGSTYQWKYENALPTDEGKADLEGRLSQMISRPFKTTAHQAGIRPSVNDRKPIIGFHPEYKSIGIFNGLGTKGISVAPFFANEFINLILNNKQLDKDVNIERFYSLYSHSEI